MANTTLSNKIHPTPTSWAAVSPAFLCPDLSQYLFGLWNERSRWLFEVRCACYPSLRSIPENAR
jgi:hypothetical protein